jgi:peptidoglycan-associated lipoprotein
LLKEDFEMRTRSVGSVIRFAALALVLAGLGCKHPAPVRPAAPEATAAPPAQPTVTLDATPANLQRGQSTTLRWTSTNATTLTLAPGIGPVTTEGSTTVSPTDSVTYTITATGPAGSADASAHVTVNAPAALPTTGASATLEELFSREVQDAYFDLDRADIRTDAKAALTKTAQFLRSYPQIKVAVEGYCDERGSTEYNLALGDRRAQAAKDFLVSLGVPADRMQTVSYGKEKPFCNEHAEACWQQNRRAHFAMAK